MVFRTSGKALQGLKLSFLSAGSGTAEAGPYLRNRLRDES